MAHPDLLPSEPLSLCAYSLSVSSTLLSSGRGTAANSCITPAQRKCAGRACLSTVGHRAELEVHAGNLQPAPVEPEAKYNERERAGRSSWSRSPASTPAKRLKAELTRGRRSAMSASISREIAAARAVTAGTDRACISRSSEMGGPHGGGCHDQPFFGKLSANGPAGARSCLSGCR